MSDLTSPIPEQPSGKGGKRIALVAGGVVLAVAAVGGGVWGYNAFYGQSDQAAEALPAEGLLGYVGFDLAPNGEQLLAARSTLKKFPAIADEITLTGDGDLRKEFFEKVQDEGTCTDLDWDKQVGPWLGDRLGFGVMDGGEGKEPELLVALETTDAGSAKKNLDAVIECMNSDSSTDAQVQSHAFVGDWLVLGEGDLADGLAAKVEKGSLADDDSFGEWTGAAGDPGILEGFVTPLGYQRFMDFALEEGELPASSETKKMLDKELKNFEGAGFVGRFRDGGLEIEAASAAKVDVASEAGEAIGSLPASTVAALGYSLTDGWFDTLLDNYGPLLESEAGMTVEEAERELTAMTGLEFDDVETLLGDAIVVAVDSDINGEAIQQFDITGVPVGLKIKGDTDEIEDVLDKLRAAGAKQGMPRGFVVSETAGDYVVVSLSPEYADKLAEESGLGKEATFGDVVHAKDAAAAFFLDFDSNDWLDNLLEDFGAPEDLRDNVSPLSGIGITSWVEDDAAHVRFKLATD